MLNATDFPEHIEMLSRAQGIKPFPKNPQPLPSLQPDVPRLDSEIAREMLPKTLSDWAVDTSERLCVPIESLAVLALGALGGIVGRQIAIRPKREDDWYEFSKRWAAIVAPPSEKKSAILGEALGPISKLEQRAKKKFAEQEAGYRAVQVSLKAQMDAIKEDMKGAAKSGSPEDLKKAESNYAALESRAMGERLSERRYRTSDATIEKLGELLTLNTNGLIVVRDELAGWISGLERQGREQDRAFYLEAWAGKSSFLVDRIGRASLNIPALSLSLMGTIQPDALKNLVFEATQGASGGDGLLQRFQLMVQPDRSEYLGIVDRKPNQEARHAYTRLFEDLSELNPTHFGATQIVSSEAGDIPAVSFSAAAQDIFYTWLDEHELKLRSGKIESAAFEAHLGKYSGLMPGLALVFHLVEVWEGKGSTCDGVSHAAAARAAEWCRFLEAHAKRIYCLAEHPEHQGAHELLKKIRTGRIKDGVPIRELYRPQWSCLKNAGHVQAAAEVLQEFGWVRLEYLPTGGAPSQVMRLHPSLIKKNEASNGNV